MTKTKVIVPTDYEYQDIRNKNGHFDQVSSEEQKRITEEYFKDRL